VRSRGPDRAPCQQEKGWRAHDRSTTVINTNKNNKEREGMTYSESTENDQITVASTNADDEAALKDFKAGLVRSMKQYNAGLIDL
jgi:hypothetical protein